jgi:hypothetical protein
MHPPPNPSLYVGRISPGVMRKDWGAWRGIGEFFLVGRRWLGRGWPGHFEGRNWRGFHHHATLLIAACGFLLLEGRLSPPPQATRDHSKLPICSFTYQVRHPSTRPEALPVSTERHNSRSMATLRRQIATTLPALCHVVRVVSADTWHTAGLSRGSLKPHPRSADELFGWKGMAPLAGWSCS